MRDDECLNASVPLPQGYLNVRLRVPRTALTLVVPN
jgi:hypothetical protein